MQNNFNLEVYKLLIAQLMYNLMNRKVWQVKRKSGAISVLKTTTYLKHRDFEKGFILLHTFQNLSCHKFRNPKY